MLAGAHSTNEVASFSRMRSRLLCTWREGGGGGGGGRKRAEMSRI